MTYICDNDVIVVPCSPGTLYSTAGIRCPWDPNKLKFKICVINEDLMIYVNNSGDEDGTVCWL